MNAKNVIAGLLTGAVCLSMMTACSQNGTGTPSGQDSMASSGQTQQGSRTEQSSSAADSQPQQSTPEDPAAVRDPQTDHPYLADPDCPAGCRHEPSRRRLFKC